MRFFAPAGRDQPPERENVEPNGHIQDGEEPKRQGPKNHARRPSAHERLFRCRLTGFAQEVALPQSQKANLIEQGLERHDRQDRKVQHPPPKQTDEGPTAPRSEGNDDKTENIESNDQDVEQQNCVRKSCEQPRCHIAAVAGRMTSARRLSNTPLRRESRRY